MDVRSLSPVVPAVLLITVLGTCLLAPISMSQAATAALTTEPPPATNAEQPDSENEESDELQIAQHDVVWDRAGSRPLKPAQTDTPLCKCLSGRQLLRPGNAPLLSGPVCIDRGADIIPLGTQWPHAPPCRV